MASRSRASEMVEGSGIAWLMETPMPGFVPHVIMGEWFPAGDSGVPGGAFRGEVAAGEVFESGVVGRDHSGAGTRLDRHVRNRHAAFHAEGADGGSGVFENRTRASADADFGAEREDDVFGGNAGFQGSIHLNFEGLRGPLQKGLGGQHVLHFAGSDAEGERSESAVRGGVAIAANHRHTGLCETEFRSDDVDDALVFGVNSVVRDAEFLAVGGQLRDLVGGDGIEDGQRAIGGGNAVVRGGDGEVGTAHFEAAFTEAGEGLGRGDFVDQMEIDID
jgi:hypothetical protein